MSDKEYSVIKIDVIKSFGRISLGISQSYPIRDSPSQFENRIMTRVYIRSIVLCTKKPHFVSQNWRMENKLY